MRASWIIKNLSIIKRYKARSHSVASLILFSCVFTACEPTVKTEAEISSATGSADRGTLDVTLAWSGSGNYTGYNAAALTPAKVCSDTAIFGVTGTAVCNSSPSVLDVTQSFVADNYASISNAPATTTYLSSVTLFGAAGLLTTSTRTQTALAAGDENNDAVTTVTATPAANDFFADFTVDLGSQFVTANICAGTTIFGRVGSAVCTALGSRGHRDIGSMVERGIPDTAKDNDGYQSDGQGNVTITRANTSALTAGCGMTQTTIAARIANCNFTWDGAASGNTGQGSWSLVTRWDQSGGGTGPYTEVWRDNRTGMIWSDWLASGTLMNWCRASGNVQDNTLNWNINCSAGGGLQPATPISTCFEDGSHDSSGYDLEKGGMRLAATGSSPSVVWRLPTRDDFLQAYTNGMGYVLPNFLNSPFWSASVNASSRSGAWYFNAASDGTPRLLTSSRSTTLRVRCVGQ